MPLPGRAAAYPAGLSRRWFPVFTNLNYPRGTNRGKNRTSAYPAQLPGAPAPVLPVWPDTSPTSAGSRVKRCPSDLYGGLLIALQVPEQTGLVAPCLACNKSFEIQKALELQ